VILHKQETCNFCNSFDAAPSSSTICNKIDISPARLITQCTSFIIVTSICYHKSMGSHNIVTEHVVETQLFASTECFTFDLVSCSLGCTVIPGLKLASRLNFWGWITGEIVPLSLQTVRLLHPFLVKVMWQDSCQGGKLMTVSVSPSSPTTVDLRQWQMLTSPFTGNSVWSTTHWCNPRTDDNDDDDDAVAATPKHPRKCCSL